MAKRSILGVMTGKLGNMVGQSNSLVSSKDKQVWRVYNGNVKNPKTIRQAAQRSLFVATKNFQQAFADILDHSWQGVDYGTKSLNHFRSMVLANGGANFPGFFYQPKGAQNFIPQPWPISRGSINVNTKLNFDDNRMFRVAGLRTVVIDPDTPDLTIGSIYKAFLNGNPVIQDGDMITVVALYTNDNTPSINSVVVPVFDRFIIDSSNTETWQITSPLQSQNGLFNGYFAVDDEVYSFTLESVANYNILAAGVIISRQNGSKNSWLRSKSTMCLNDQIHVTDLYGSSEYITACLDTFMNSEAAAESDWYLNQTGENEDESGSVGPTPTPVQISVETREAALTPEGSVNAAYVLNGSQSGYLVYGGKYFVLNDTELTDRSFAADTEFADTVVCVILTETLKAQIEAAGYSFVWTVEPDNP